MQAGKKVGGLKAVWQWDHVFWSTAGSPLSCPGPGHGGKPLTGQSTALHEKNLRGNFHSATNSISASPPKMLLCLPTFLRTLCPSLSRSPFDSLAPPLPPLVGQPVLCSAQGRQWETEMMEMLNHHHLQGAHSLVGDTDKSPDHHIPVMRGLPGDEGLQEH